MTHRHRKTPAASCKHSWLRAWLSSWWSPAKSHGCWRWSGKSASRCAKAAVGAYFSGRSPKVCNASTSISAVRNAARDHVQTSLNLAYGSAMASIGLTIPTIALASVFLSGPLILGLGASHMVLLAMTVAVGTLTFVPGRATLVQGGVHLALMAAYLVLAVSP